MTVDLIEVKTTVYHVTIVEDFVQSAGTSTTTTKQIEVAPFTKLYRLPYASGFLKELGPAGRHLFLYLLYRIPKDQTWLDLPKEGVCSELGISERTYYNAINDLTTMSVIEKRSNKKKDTSYWVNPLFFFRGDRKSYFKEKNPDALEVVKTREVTKKLQVIE